MLGIIKKGESTLNLYRILYIMGFQCRRPPPLFRSDMKYVIYTTFNRRELPSFLHILMRFNIVNTLSVCIIVIFSRLCYNNNKFYPSHVRPEDAFRCSGGQLPIT